MPDASTNPVQEIVEESEEKDTSQDQVDVTPVAKASEIEQLAAKIKADFEALYGSRLSQVEKSFENFRHGAYRIQDDLKRQNLQLQATLEKGKVLPRDGTATPADPWSGIENGQTWKSEIEKLAEQKAEEKLKTWQAEQQMQTVAKQQQDALEASKHQVIERYPDLDPETGTVDSAVSKAYVTALNAHPDWLTNPYGPLLAMYAMEEQLAASAPPSGKKGTPPNLHLPPSRPGPSGESRLTLTREQKAFCDRYGLKPEDYLKTATALEQGAVEA